ncbi:MAG: hypothetical protein ABIU87_08690 [Ornithinibacter sp.]
MSTALRKQSARQAARREALELQAEFRAGRVEREKRLSRLGVWVTAAMRERDAAISRYEAAQRGRSPRWSRTKPRPG